MVEDRKMADRIGRRLAPGFTVNYYYFLPIKLIFKI